MILVGVINYDVNIEIYVPFFLFFSNLSLI